MKNPNFVTESISSAAKPDRLSVFFETFELSVTVVPPRNGVNLYVTPGKEGGGPGAIVFSARGNPARPPVVLVCAAVDFGGRINPLMNAMPDTVVVRLDEVPALRDTTDAFVAEAMHRRCGRHVALNRLGEVMVLMILRSAMERGGTGPGLLAGLSHPALQKVLVALHDGPGRPWPIEELALIAGMSRSRFMTVFREVVGTTPNAYLRSWRLSLGYRRLARGDRVKAVAREVGFTSAAGFSRAYSREFGHPPKLERRLASLEKPAPR